MARCLSTIALATLLVAGGVAVAAPDAAALGTQQAARKRAAARDALQQVQEARLAYAAKRYTHAVEHYRNALSVLPQGEETDKLRAFINQSLADALIARAIDYRSVGRYEEAQQFLHEALQLDPKNQRARLELAYTDDPERTNPALTPQHVGDVEEVTRLLRQGYAYLDLGKYDEATKTFRTVAQYDGYNAAAQRGMERAAQLRQQYYLSMHDARRADLLTEVDKGWYVKPGAPEGAVPTAPAAPAEQEQSASPDSIHEEQIASMLNEIVVPHFELDQNDVHEFIDTLRNIIRQNENKASGTHPRLNISTDFGSIDTPAAKALFEKRFSLKLDEVTLRQIIDETAPLYGLDYYVTPTGVELSLGNQSGRILSRKYTGIDPHIFDKDDEDEEPRDVFDPASAGLRVKRMDPRKYLEAQGVTFPEGSSVRYSAGTRTLVMNNTRKNLELAGEILDTSSDVVERNIVLNIIMVEVSEHDLEDLGFEWLLQTGFQSGDNDYNIGGGVEAAVAGAAGLPLISTRRTVPSRESPVVTQGLRGIREASGRFDMDNLIESGSAKRLSGSLTQTPPIFGLRGVWSAADLSVIMRGLSQKKGVDVLFNPRLVLDPNIDEMVTFTNVRELIFPMEYDAPSTPELSYIYRRPANGWSNRQNNGDGDGNGNGRNGRNGRNGTNYDADEDGVTSNYNALDEFFRMWFQAAEDQNNNNSNGNNNGGGRTNMFNRRNQNIIGMAGTATPAFPREFVNYTQDEGEMDLLYGEGAIIRVSKAEPIDGGSKVKLSMLTRINEFEGFLDWGSPINAPMSTMGENSETRTVMLSPNHIFQPIFRSYTVNTNLVVADGAVLVIGGLRESRIVRYEDKVPILGDLPFVGRLFRSEGESRRSRALLIFAKVNVITPDGKSIHEGQQVEMDPLQETP